MKKRLLSILLFLISANGVYAQSEDLYTKFLQAGYPYRESLQKYTQSRAQHLQYGSISTRQELIVQTKDLLIKRNNLQISYLEYLRFELGRVTNVSEYSHTVVYLDLEREIDVLKSFFIGLDTKNSFRELRAQLDAWDKKVDGQTDLIQIARLQIATAKLIAFQDQVRVLTSDFATGSSVINLVNDKLTLSRSIIEPNNIGSLQSSKKLVYDALLLLDDLYKRR